MKAAFAIILACLTALVCIAVPSRPLRANAQTAPKTDAYKGYVFTPLPAFDQFDKSELAQLCTVGFDPRTVDFTDALASEGIPRALKLTVKSTGLKVLSSSRHLHVKDEVFYDGLTDVGGKTFNGDVVMKGHDGFMFRVDGYKDAMVVTLRRSPCGGPYGNEGDAEHKALYDRYGIGPYYRTATIFPDENGYVKVEFGCVHGGYVWWEQGTLQQEFDGFNSVDIVFSNQKIAIGTEIMVSDFKLYDEPAAGRTLEELIAALEREGERSAVGKYVYQSGDAAFDAAADALRSILASGRNEA